MEKGTAPAWQAREIARAKVLEPIKQTIMGMEDEFENRFDLYRFVLHLIDMKLFVRSETLSTVNTACEIMYMDTFSCTSRNAGTSMLRALMDADVTIKKFQRAPEEGSALWAKIFEWAAAQIVNTHLSALQALEMSQPLLIYRVTDRTKEVSVE